MVGFLRGIMLGGVVASFGLVAASQLAGPVAVGPMGGPGTGMAGDGSVPAATEGVIGAVVPDADMPEAGPAASPEVTLAPIPPTETPADSMSAAPPQVASDAPDVAQGSVSIDPPAAPSAGADAAPVATDMAAPTLGLEGDTPAATATAPAEPPVQPPSTAPDGGQQTPDAGTAPVPPLEVAPGTLPAAAVPAAPVAPGSETAPRPADLPPPMMSAPEQEALLQPLPDAVPRPVPEAVSEAVPEPAPSILAPDQNATFAPNPALGDKATGPGRLPRIGDPPAAPAADAATGPGPDVVAVADLPPLQRYARAFDGASGKPLFAILLEDTGGTDVDRAELAALAIPLTIVIDPLSPGAADRAAIWRAGGQEVVMSASGIPAGAKASDLEQTFQALNTALPEAVAVIDPDGATFQDNRPLATMVVPILAGQGRGLVTFDRGLNAADQVARREKLAATKVFRRIDAEDEDAPVIRRYLDRAAFKAAQDGRVAVMGTLRPETVAAILEWTIEGKSATVTLAPVSALMAQPGG